MVNIHEDNQLVYVHSIMVMTLSWQSRGLTISCNDCGLVHTHVHVTKQYNSVRPNGGNTECLGR